MEIVVDSPTHGKHTVLIDRRDCQKFGLNKDRLYLNKVGRYLYVRVKPNKIYLHRLITDAPKNKVIDHINRNTLDNRRKNIRVGTIQDNLRNQKRSDNKTGYTGVTIAYNGKYSAQIKINYKKIHLGIFNTIGEAWQARKRAERKYYDGGIIAYTV